MKRQKVDDELSDKEIKQLNLIKKIIDERQKNKIGRRTNFLTGSTYNCSIRPFESVSKRVPSWSFFPAVDNARQRVYIRFRSEEAVESEIKNLSWHAKSVQLLSSPANNLISNAFEKIEKDEALKLSSYISHQENTVKHVDNTADLWVEKYKPHKYLDLLSDESTNRMLLHWLKLWDKVVFNKEVNLKKRTSNVVNNKYGTKFFKKNFGLDEELDDNKCPKMKLALLCGPPGLGKTTLAHLVAKQAGYNVVEINASDDRNPTSFKIKLEASTQMSSVMGTDCRPNCLILDEIDGAPMNTIDVLLKFALEKKSSRKKKPNKQEEKSSILKRPIICICNDVYVPALRNLRQNAFVLNFPPTSSARLAERLMEISSYEKIKTDMSAMTALSTKTNNDIRSCLSTLSCYRHQQLRSSDIKNSSIGNKDMQKGLFSVWQEIFQIKKSYFDSNSLNGEDDHSNYNNVMKDRVDSVLKTVQSYGDYEKLSQGVYENFLSLKQKDSSISSAVEGLDWFCEFDRLTTVINTSQNYSLYPYLPYSFATWHCLFAAFTWPKITYPSASYEAMVKKNKYKQIVDELMSGITPCIRTFLHFNQILLDTMPLLMHIAVPNLRSVSIQLFTLKEKEDLGKVINIMIEYGLNYYQERSIDGSFNFLLTPSIDEAIKFPGLDSFPTISYATKQIISREIDIEKMRRRTCHIETDLELEKIINIDAKEKAVLTPKNQKGVREKPLTPNHLQKLTPKILKPAKSLKRKDFFGREISSPVISKHKEIRDEIVKSDIWFHFKEGYNNAVRKSVLMKDLY
ncbi:chromosome transmission fidelity protein 18 homolog isoform X2 [Daktulosphaira vitifoliae]|nr:chromosome transmission fidelity protein 18 homolog isoform X2 [Daktulosphaira vitifoliae]